MTSNIRILLAKPTHDCHDRGVRYLARKLVDAGFEVIFTNFLLAQEVVQTAVEEDVEVVGISSSSGGHLPVFEDLVAGLAETGLDDVLLIGGGVIPQDDEAALLNMGVAAVFGPGSKADDVIAVIRDQVPTSKGAGF